MQSIWRNSSNQGTCIKAYKTDAGTEKFMNSVKEGPNEGAAPDMSATFKIKSEEKPGTCLLRAELLR